MSFDCIIVWVSWHQVTNKSACLCYDLMFWQSNYSWTIQVKFFYWFIFRKILFTFHPKPVFSSWSLNLKNHFHKVNSIVVITVQHLVLFDIQNAMISSWNINGNSNFRGFYCCLIASSIFWLSIALLVNSKWQ